MAHPNGNSSGSRIAARILVYASETVTRDGVLITAAIVGAEVTRAQTPHVPYSPEEIAREAKRCAEAGAAVVHLHVRNEDGSPSQDEKLFRQTIELIRARCDVVGVMGRDGGGALLRRELDLLGIGSEGLVAAEDRPTTQKTRVLARRQQVVRYDHEVDADVGGEVAARLVQAVSELAGPADVIVVEDYNKGVVVPPVIQAVLHAAPVGA